MRCNIKKLVICLLVFSAVGCARFNTSDIKASEYVCHDRGGVESFVYSWGFGPRVRCNDTTYFHMDAAGRIYRNYIAGLKEKNDEVQ